MISDVKTSPDFTSCRKGPVFFTYDANIFDNPTDDIFAARFWQAQDAVLGQAQGRGTTWFVRHGEHELVLRHYYRGGLVGKFLTDHYLFTGIQRSRAYREFELLKTLQQLGLAAPAPVAFKVLRSGGIYCVSDIITRCVPGATSLVQLVLNKQLNDEVLMNVGACIRQFHDHHVYHHDLNAHNILLDENRKVWIIDFDQGEIRTNQKTWKHANVLRLQRSLAKEKHRLAGFDWHDAHWQMLLSGYHS